MLCKYVHITMHLSSILFVFSFLHIGAFKFNWTEGMMFRKSSILANAHAYDTRHEFIYSQTCIHMLRACSRAIVCMRIGMCSTRVSLACINDIMCVQHSFTHEHSASIPRNVLSDYKLRRGLHHTKMKAYSHIHCCTCI